MKVVSLIYMGLDANLKDDYLGGTEVDADPERALATEQQNRAIVDNFHAKQYPRSYDPGRKQGGEGTDEELDSNFKENYQEWLDSEVYGGQEGQRKLFRKFSREVLKGLGSGGDVETASSAPSVVPVREDGIGLWKDLVEDEMFGSD